MKNRQANLPTLAPNWSRQPSACRCRFQPRATIRCLVLLLLLCGVFSNAHAAPNNSVRTLVTDRKGSLWLGTANGVFYLPKRDTDPSHRLHLLPSQIVMCMLEDRDGSILVGTRNGLYRIQDAQSHSSPSKGLPDPATHFTFAHPRQHGDTSGPAPAAGGLALASTKNRRQLPMPINSRPASSASVQRAVEDSTRKSVASIPPAGVAPRLPPGSARHHGRPQGIQLTSVLLEKADSIPWILSRRRRATPVPVRHRKTRSLSPPRGHHRLEPRQRSDSHRLRLPRRSRRRSAADHLLLQRRPLSQLACADRGIATGSTSHYDTAIGTPLHAPAKPAYHRLDFGKYNFEVQARNLG